VCEVVVYDISCISRANLAYGAPRFRYSQGFALRWQHDCGAFALHSVMYEFVVAS
jgi:hypothetical protein